MKESINNMIKNKKVSINYSCRYNDTPPNKYWEEVTESKITDEIFPEIIKWLHTLGFIILNKATIISYDAIACDTMCLNITSDFSNKLYITITLTKDFLLDQNATLRILLHSNNSNFQDLYLKFFVTKGFTDEQSRNIQRLISTILDYALETNIYSEPSKELIEAFDPSPSYQE